MELLQAIKLRHSVRSYNNTAIDSETVGKLQNVVEQCNADGGLHIQLITNEPKAFDSFMAHYGKFSGVTNYVALIGKKGMDEAIGYYGEKIVLEAQMLGLNTCWVALTYKKIKNAFKVGKGEKLYCVLSIGYGATQGVEHKIKTYEDVSSTKNAPEWFVNGVNASLLAPTAMNQQKFTIDYKDGKVIARALSGFYTKIDLGIVKYHFEIGAGDNEVIWG